MTPDTLWGIWLFVLSFALMGVGIGFVLGWILGERAGLRAAVHAQAGYVEEISDVPPMEPWEFDPPDRTETSADGPRAHLKLESREERRARERPDEMARALGERRRGKPL